MEEKLRLYRLIVKNRIGKREYYDSNDARCQYIYCPLSKLKMIVSDTRDLIGDYSILVAFDVEMGKFLEDAYVFD